MTFVGVYSGALIANGQAPLTVPILCANINLLLGEEGIAAGSRLELRKIKADGTMTVLTTAEVPEIDPADIPEGRLITPDSVPNILMNATLRISPFNIQEEHVLRAVLIIGDDEHRLGSLNVQLSGSES